MVAHVLGHHVLEGVDGLGVEVGDVGLGEAHVELGEHVSPCELLAVRDAEIGGGDGAVVEVEALDVHAGLLGHEDAPSARGRGVRARGQRLERAVRPRTTPTNSWRTSSSAARGQARAMRVGSPSISGRAAASLRWWSRARESGMRV